MRIVVATGNAHKLTEIRDALDGLPIEVVSIFDIDPQWDCPEETAVTFAGNAAIKAEAGYKRTGLPCLADDSGLVVDALDGAPGVWSARYAGENATDADNNAKLLKELATVATKDRTARFISSLSVVGLDALAPSLEHLLVFEGSAEGSILFEPQGENGFGYDPLFTPDVFPGRTYAELTMQEKNQISHRGKALAEFSAFLRNNISSLA